MNAVARVVERHRDVGVVLGCEVEAERDMLPRVVVSELDPWNAPDDVGAERHGLFHQAVGARLFDDAVPRESHHLNVDDAAKLLAHGDQRLDAFEAGLAVDVRERADVENAVQRRQRRGAAGVRRDPGGVVFRLDRESTSYGFCVLKAKARGHRDLVTVVGHAAIISAGEWITASGEWINDRTHGQQFKARFLKTSAPSSIDGIEKYPASGMIRGIGPVYAKKMVKAFGDKVFDIIEAEPDRLREVAGIGPMRAKRITDAWAEQKVVGADRRRIKRDWSRRWRSRARLRQRLRARRAVQGDKRRHVGMLPQTVVQRKAGVLELNDPWLRGNAPTSVERTLSKAARLEA